MAGVPGAGGASASAVAGVPGVGGASASAYAVLGAAVVGAWMSPATDCAPSPAMAADLWETNRAVPAPALRAHARPDQAAPSWAPVMGGAVMGGAAGWAAPRPERRLCAAPAPPTAAAGSEDHGDDEEDSSRAGQVSSTNVPRAAGDRIRKSDLSAGDRIRKSDSDLSAGDRIRKSDSDLSATGLTPLLIPNFHNDVMAAFASNEAAAPRAPAVLLGAPRAVLGAPRAAWAAAPITAPYAPDGRVDPSSKFKRKRASLESLGLPPPARGSCPPPAASDSSGGSGE